MSKSADRLNSAINDFAESRNRGDALFELFKRATSFRDQGDHRQAIELLSQVLRERPVSAVLNERAITYSACQDVRLGTISGLSSSRFPQSIAPAAPASRN